MKKIFTIFTMLVCTVSFTQTWILIEEIPSITNGYIVTPNSSNPNCVATVTYAFDLDNYIDTLVLNQSDTIVSNYPTIEVQIEYGVNVIAYARSLIHSNQYGLKAQSSSDASCDNSIVFSNQSVNCDFYVEQLYNTNMSNLTSDYTRLEGECTFHSVDEFGNTESVSYYNLCPGLYAEGSYKFFLGDPRYFFPEVETKKINIQTINENEFNACDGSATVTSLENFINPQEYIWSHDSSLNGLNADSLCSGYYNVSVVDFDGDTISKDFVITNFIEDFTWNNDNEDTLYLIHPECQINFNLPIDSVVIEEFFPLNLDSTILVMSWSIYQAGNAFYFSDILDDVDIDNTVIYVGIYCNNPGKSNESVKMIKFNLNSDNEAGPLSIAENGFDTEFSVYPNPTNGTFYIDYSEQVEAVDLLNSDGQIIQSLKMNNDISNLSNGIYFIRITSKSEFVTKKIIKE